MIDSQFKIMADCAPVLLWISDTTGMCYYFNKRWLDFRGRTMEQEIGNGWAEGVHPEDLKPCVDFYFDHFNRHKEFKMEYRLRRHDGEYRWILDNGVPRFSDVGKFEGFIGSCIDIADRKKMEFETRQLIAAKDYFARITSHEMRTPLSKLKMVCDILNDDGLLDPDLLPIIKKAADESYQNFNKINSATSLLSSFSSMTSDQMSPVSVQFIIKSSVSLIKTSVKNEKQEIDIAVDLTDIRVDETVLGNEELLSRLIAELLTNAIKFSPLNKKVSIMAKRVGLNYLISVTDQGPGIPLEKINSVFLPFFSLQNPIYHTKNNYQLQGSGVGLGLTIVKMISDFHNSSIEILPGENGVGTVVQFKIPAMKN